MLQHGNIFVTGGAGTLGNAIARVRQEEGWEGKLTVYSRDSHKHDKMRRQYPDINFIQGDILNPETLYLSMIGHDIVIHAAACKVIPDSERDTLYTIGSNIDGSAYVFSAALQTGISHVVSISTDKAAYPVNAYGASKFLMEKTCQEYARAAKGEHITQFHLVRYGNVLESSSSVIEAWKKAVSNGETIKVTDPEMTRFWISPRQAVELVFLSLTKTESGEIYIPKASALSIGKLALYTVGAEEYTRIPIRPGEKMHECLVTQEESHYARDIGKAFIVRPTTEERSPAGFAAYTSDTAPELSQEELEELLYD